MKIIVSGNSRGNNGMDRMYIWLKNDIMKSILFRIYIQMEITTGKSLNHK